MAKKLYLQSKSDDPTVDDSNDFIYNIEGTKIYAITRSIYCKSIVFIKIINHFGESGGFDKIYDRISDTKNWAPIDVVTNLITVIGNVHAILHREFCYEYIPKLKEAVWKNILKSPDSNIRNFTKEKLDNIVSAFDGLLKRTFSIPEKLEVNFFYIFSSFNYLFFQIDDRNI